MTYTAPLTEYAFLLHDVFDVSVLSRTDRFADSTPDIFDGVLDEAAKLAEQVLAPLNRPGDEAGCGFDAGAVSTPPGFREAYREFREGGWAGLNLSAEYGGQGLPNTLYALVNELFSTANPGFAMYRGLIEGAFNTIETFGTDAMKAEYLPAIAGGEMLPTMNLTEPQAGSDLGLLRTKAEPGPDDSYTLTGTKIFITGGEHDLTPNIPHLVLARLPDAPPGSRGISLFLAPKFYRDADGKDVRNRITCSGIEHKMGLKSSATCVMNFEGARAWRIGAPHAGLGAMFTMMNAARLIVGMQGICAAEGVLQIATAYAAERRQGTAPGVASDGPHSIDQHPDVIRMLRTIKAFAQGGRALILRTTLAHDLSLCAPDAADRERHEGHVDLLTPIVKAFLTDCGNEAASLGVQVLGGHGYIREWGVEQWMRDVRIAAIYEGTNGIQATDLVGRKLSMRGGSLPGIWIEEARQTFTKAQPRFAPAAAGERALGELEQLTVAVQRSGPVERADVATDYLAVFGLVALAREWTEIACTALDKRDMEPAFCDDKLATASFYLTRILPRHLAHARIVRTLLED